MEFGGAPPDPPKDHTPDPPCLDYIWHWFRDLSDKREMGFGIAAIKHDAIRAFSDCYGLEISPWEVSVLDDLDTTFRVIRHELDEAEKNKTTPQDLARDREDMRRARIEQKARRGKRRG